MNSVIDYRSHLRAEFERRLEKNKRYSLRAFARDLTLDPGQLSLVLNGKKNISLLKASEISKQLFKTPREMMIFYHSVELEHASNEALRESIIKRLDYLHTSVASRESNISHDEFETISDWFNLPMLELAGHARIEVTPDSAAAYLGISPIEARSGLETMTRLGFIKKVGQVYKKIKSVVTTTEIPSLAIKRFHHQMSYKAQQALFSQSVERRYFNSLTITVPPEKLPEFKKMIDENDKRVRDFARTFQNDPNAEIYQFSSQLFSLKEGSP